MHHDDHWEWACAARARYIGSNSRFVAIGNDGVGDAIEAIDAHATINDDRSGNHDHEAYQNAENPRDDFDSFFHLLLLIKNYVGDGGESPLCGMLGSHGNDGDIAPTILVRPKKHPNRGVIG